ncbi:hypothetical protein H257_09291 [Aphanomyces astaci]|uniref:Dolichyl-diphosphooligosaccharide-protein glycosyltransferase subunit OST5 n=1 Tax=Aphanomyces astaci TaxID=112090 RepID=W4GCP9_APHAT|nr:hypothetical protein H257_09291 [Aphanomyces astaci]ETV76854.1 hypothetical protein H257_09291 [Aphanomyces astaci]|eukprot:XP_009833766.1 hypothetical protein H257_09291 [Aphanomyces astaci]
MLELPYSSPVPVDYYGLMSLLLIVVGLVFTAGYFTKSIIVEYAYAAMASLFLGTLRSSFSSWVECMFDEEGSY